VPKRIAGYKFTGAVNIETRVKEMIKDIKSFFLHHRDVYRQLSEDARIYPRGPETCSKPFCTCVVLLGLTNSFDRLKNVVEAAGQNKFFWDYHRDPNPDVLVKRIRKWFDKHPQSSRQN